MNRRPRYGDQSYQRTQAVERLPPQVVRHMFSFGETVPDTTNQFRRPSLQVALSKHNGRLLEDIIESEPDRKIVGMIMANTEPLIGDANRLAMVAAVKNYPRILELAVENGANNFDDIGKVAARAGHINIVKYAVENGEWEYDEMVNNANQFAIIAASSGHLDIVKYAVSMGMRDYNLIADWAAVGGHIHIVKYAVEKGARDFDLIALTAAEYDHVNVVAYAIDQGALNFGPIIEAGAVNGYLDVVKYGLKKQGEVPGDLEGVSIFNVDDLVRIGAENGHLNIVEYAAMKTPLDFNQIALAAIEWDNNLEIVDYAIENAQRQGVPINLNDLALKAAEFQSIRIIKYLLNRGATNLDEILEIIDEELLE